MKKQSPQASKKRTAKAPQSRGKQRPKKKPKGKRLPWLRFLLKWLVLLGVVASIPFALWVWWLDSQVVARFEGQKWQVPAEVYSAPTVLRDGSPWRKEDLESLLEDVGYRFGRNSQNVGWAARSASKVSAHLRPFTDHDGYHPQSRRIFSFENGLLRISGLNGERYETAVLEPQKIGYLYSGNTESRDILSYEQIPESLINILIATEDRDFFDHIGISFTGIARAAMVNMTSGARRQGGSTLTQQLIKNMYLTSERTYTRKLTEVIMALLLERHYSKEAILTAYVNEVYLAQEGNSALHGFAAASQFFFARPLNELNIDEQALLVGMVKGPSLYNPRRNPERSKQRRNVVLDLLYQQGRLSSQSVAVLKKQPIRLASKTKRKTIFGDYLDLVAMQLEKDFSSAELATENLRIYTGLDVRAQKAAIDVMHAQVAQLEHQDSSLKGLQGAMVVTDRRTGQVRAIVGSSDDYYSGFNRSLAAVRPIGSLVKPSIYLAAIASGRYSWWDRVQDEPKQFKVGNTLWEPQNYGRTSHGTVPLYLALAKSYNLATIDLANQLGFDRVGDTLRQLGVKRPFTMYPSVALGSIELSPFEVARLYQPIASTGASSELGVVLSVMDQSGKILKRFDRKTDVPFTDASLAVTLAGMTKVPQIGTAKASQAVFPSLRFAAKTGTTNDQRDSWFVAITDEYSSTVWLGKDENVPMSITGSSGAQRVWINFAKQLPQGSLPRALPTGARYFTVANDTFELAAERCDDKIELPFIRGTEPRSSTSCLWPF
ncbi:penicillin-binding protein [Marinomonas piezotolerans]|uniref:Penicillin-binding protein 1B n=2 Tax=Marinomonas piezotolerans TaxID=2213058 RepID=A0A370UA29_9GAMM|nr:penicillin-binding protein [Marinomonas piezotolerans]